MGYDFTIKKRTLGASSKTATTHGLPAPKPFLLNKIEQSICPRATFSPRATKREST